MAGGEGSWACGTAVQKWKDPLSSPAYGFMEARSAIVQVTACDVGDKASVYRLVRDTHDQTAPLCGVIHAAGVLRDALFMNQTVEDLETVWGPKVTGALNLHGAVCDHAGANESVRMFVMFSSVSSLLGGAGQANYAAANAAMDAVALTTSHGAVRTEHPVGCVAGGGHGGGLGGAGRDVEAGDQRHQQQRGAGCAGPVRVLSQSRCKIGSSRGGGRGTDAVGCGAGHDRQGTIVPGISEQIEWEPTGKSGGIQGPGQPMTTFVQSVISLPDAPRVPQQCRTC